MVAAAAAASVVAQRPVDNIEHIVVFMQENRAFDHYYGTQHGLRGFYDRAVHPMPSGLPAFYQPSSLTNASAYLLPFHVSTLTTSAICMDAPTMDYFHDILILDGGRLDAWNTGREPGMGMSYFNRTDLPFYYRLTEEFATGDQYFQSTLTCTNPNRMHLFTGSNGLSVGQPAVMDNTEPAAGYPWVTMGEVLEEAGVSWQVLQMEDNFDDNGFAWFTRYKGANAPPGTPWFDKGMATVPDLVQAFDQLVSNKSLAQVTWIVGPASLSEHATNHPCAGEDLTARLLAVLSNPEHADMYAKTAFILNYDEGGQFVDHHWLPNIPNNPNTAMEGPDGVSNIPVKEESNIGMPIGPGFRVPLVIVSPWTRGNVVVSETFDHTSVVRLIEQRFNVTCPNISPWRRGVLGDMTSAFNFDAPDYSWPQLPNTSAYIAQGNEECNTLPPPTLPAEQSYPYQEKGVRISRALPYAISTTDAWYNDTTLSVTISQADARTGAAFHLFDLPNLKAIAPRKYGVAAASSITDKLPLVSAPQYYFALHGPNGYVRTFAGNTEASGGIGMTVSASMEYEPASQVVTFFLSNAASKGTKAVFTITDHAYGFVGPVSAPSPAAGPWTFTLDGQTARYAVQFNVSSSGCWYDFSVDADLASSMVAMQTGAASAAPIPFSRRFMGRMEIGRDTISDPAMDAGVPGYVPVPHMAKDAEEWAAMVTRHKRLGGPLDFDLQFASQGSSGSLAASAGAGAGGIVHPPVPSQYRFFKRNTNATDKDHQYVWLPPVPDM